MRKFQFLHQQAYHLTLRLIARRDELAAAIKMHNNTIAKEMMQEIPTIQTRLDRLINLGYGS